MLATKQLQFLCPRREALNNTIDLIWFVARLPYFSDDDIAVNTSVNSKVPLSSNKTVLFAMVEPVASPPCTNKSLQLVRLHPHYVIYTLIPGQQRDRGGLVTLPLSINITDIPLQKHHYTVVDHSVVNKSDLHTLTPRV